MCVCGGGGGGRIYMQFLPIIHNEFIQIFWERDVAQR